MRTLDISAIPSLSNGSKPREVDYTASRTIMLVYGFSPVYEINNRAVEMIEQGKFPSAEALLLQIVNEKKPLAAAINNLGVVREIAGDSAQAWESYSRACILDPDNEYFRSNMLNVEKQR